jgi:hypothetical protein
MHLAASAGAATLGLFGPTPAHEYAPAGPRASAVLSPSASMLELSVESALAAATQLLRRVSSPHPAPYPTSVPARTSPVLPA